MIAVKNKGTCILANQPMPSISVVMAVHIGVNYQHMLLAIESIIAQTWTEFEFIIVCDGQLNTEQESYLQSLQQESTVVSVIKLDRNLGPGAARNAGIKSAKGKYIAIMDSDDIALPKRLEYQFSYLEEHEEIAVVGGFCDVINDDGVIIGSRKLPLTPKSILSYSLFFCPLNNPTVMGRSEVFKRYMYEETIRQGEDYRLWIKLLKEKYNLANVNEVLIQFRVSTNLYKRRSGFRAGLSDMANRLYAMQLSPVYLMPFVLLFSMGTFVVRFMPVSAIRFLTTSLERVRAKLIN